MEYLTYEDLTERWGVTHSTLRVWKHRGKLPEPDLVIGGSPVWKTSTIEKVEDRNGRSGKSSQ